MYGIVARCCIRAIILLPLNAISRQSNSIRYCCSRSLYYRISWCTLIQRRVGNLVSFYGFNNGVFARSVSFGKRSFNGIRIDILKIINNMQLYCIKANLCEASGHDLAFIRNPRLQHLEAIIEAKWPLLLHNFSLKQFNFKSNELINDQSYLCMQLYTKLPRARVAQVGWGGGAVGGGGRRGGSPSETVKQRVGESWGEGAVRDRGRRKGHGALLNRKV